MLSISPERKRAITQEWLDLTLHTYPGQTLNFLLRETDPFRNPLGHALRIGIPVLVDELFGGMDSEKVAQALTDIIRIRAVQNFSAREAVAFVFLLKGVAQPELSNSGPDRIELDRRIDELALSAFDFYTQCRAKISDVRVNEARRKVALLDRIYSEAEGR